MKLRRYVRIAIFLIPIFIYLPQIPGCVFVAMPKHGRIVDKATGRGIEDVAVISTDEFSVCNEIVGFHCSVNKEYRVVVRTSKDGNFSVPGQLGSLSAERFMPWFLLNGETKTNILIIPFKPEYILSEDVHLAPKQFPESLVTERNSYSPTIPDLQMERATMPFEDLAPYYAAIVMAGSQRFMMDETDSHVIESVRAPGQGYLTDHVCSMAPETILRWPVTHAVSIFFDADTAYNVKRHVYVPSSFRKSLFALEPQGFKNVSGDIAYDPAYPGFHAGNICKTISNIRSGQ